MSEIKPWIYLPLDETFGPVLRDASGNQRNARLEGSFRVVPDETFGQHILLINETARGKIILPKLNEGDIASGATVMVWLHSSAVFLEFGPEAVALSISLTSVDYELLGIMPRPSNTPSLNYTRPPRDGWSFFAATFPRVGLPRLVWPQDATLIEDTNALPTEWKLVDLAAPDAPPTLYSLGRTHIARFRIYGQVLDDAQIDAIRRSDIDQLPHLPAVSESRLPIDFALQNGNGASALLLETEGQGQSMTLQVAPTGEACRLSALHGDVSATNWHFRLAFRPGTLKRLDQIRVIGSEWKLFAAHESGQDALYLLAENAPTLPLRIDLTGFYVDERQGPRTTRIQLAYQQVERVGNGIRTGRVQIECG